MALSDTKLRTLAPRNRPWQLADHDGLVIEVSSSHRTKNLAFPLPL